MTELTTEPMSDRLHVLVPTDGSDVSRRALPYALDVLRGRGELTILTVLPEHLEQFTANEAIRLTQSEIERRSRRAAQRMLSGLVDSVTDRAAGIRVTPAIVHGDPAPAIADAARTTDLIIMATHGRGTMGRVAFGSVADLVSRISPVPVMLIRSVPDQPARSSDQLIRRIVALIDNSELSRSSLPVVERLALRLDVPTLLLTAVDPVSAYPVLEAELAPTSQELGNLAEGRIADVAAMQSEARATLVRAGVDVTTRSVQGLIVPSLLAELRPDDLVVMTSHGRRGFQRVLLGSVADKIMRSSSAPVLLVRLPRASSAA